MYLEAVDASFGTDVDYATLQKTYGSFAEGQKPYSPAECIGTKVAAVKGHLDSAHASTSYVGRQHLTLRMSMRRSTRLTNAFSKRLENHAAAISLHLAF